MLYVWRENVKLHTLSRALVRKPHINNQLLARETKKRTVTFKDSARCGGKVEIDTGLCDMMGQHLDGLETPNLDGSDDNDLTPLSKGEPKSELKSSCRSDLRPSKEKVSSLAHGNISKHEKLKKESIVDGDTKRYEVKWRSVREVEVRTNPEVLG